MNTEQNNFDNNLIEDSEFYAEYGYCITPEEHIKEANNEIVRLLKVNRELLEACKQAQSFINSLKLGIKKTYSISVILNEAIKKGAL